MKCFFPSSSSLPIIITISLLTRANNIIYQTTYQSYCTSYIHCNPQIFVYQGNIIRFRPHKNLISAKVVGKLGLLPHSIGSTLPKSPNRKNELIELFQSNSLNRPQSLCNLGVESPPRLEKCPNRVGEEMAFCVTQKKEKDEIC